MLEIVLKHDFVIAICSSCAAQQSHCTEHLW
jgi:hypothetical protein